MLIGLIALVALAGVIYLIRKDKRQSQHALLVNYPIIGRGRYLLEKIGVFMRQYWFSTDGEEFPFSRATRSQVYRMAKNEKNVLSFGSSNTPPDEYFSNALFPLEREDADRVRTLTVGKDCDFPFVQKRLVSISGMSFGALSGNAIRALSLGAAEAGITMNTGEGGKPSEYHLTNPMISHNNDGGIVVQIGTANFGYRTDDGRLDYDKLATLRDLHSVKWVQIKLAQGAKPGQGGKLPGAKVTPEIAALRDVPVGVDCNSPSKNPDCQTPDALLETIKKVKQATGKPVGIKIAIADVSELKALITLGIQKDKQCVDKTSFLPSVITVDGGDGGTGAAPAVSMESIALPVKQILQEVSDTLRELNVKENIALVASGKLVTAHDATIAFAMGADWIESARGFMMALGCINALECYKDTCPVGIATQNKKLQQALVPESKKVRVANYARNLENEIFDVALACGVSHPRDMTMSHIKKSHQPSDKIAIPIVNVA